MRSVPVSELISTHEQYYQLHLSSNFILRFSGFSCFDRTDLVHLPDSPTVARYESIELIPHFISSGSGIDGPSPTDGRVVCARPSPRLENTFRRVRIRSFPWPSVQLLDALRSVALVLGVSIVRPV